MQYLQNNTSEQKLYLSLFEGRYTLAAFSHYMIGFIHEENSNVGESLYQVPTIVSDGSRYTELEVTTIGLTNSGRYRYIVYGQNSSSNINPEDNAVVGIVEIGYLVIGTDTEFYDVPQNTILNDIIIE
jgi:hypothetical protein